MQNKDESFFRNHAEEIEFLRDTNMKVHWNDSLSDNTKNAIWQYLQSLYMLGMMISAIPPETMSMIENMAEQLEGKIKTDGIDEDALMKSMMSLMGGASSQPTKNKKK